MMVTNAVWCHSVLCCQSYIRSVAADDRNQAGAPLDGLLHATAVLAVRIIRGAVAAVWRHPQHCQHGALTASAHTLRWSLRRPRPAAPCSDWPVQALVAGHRDCLTLQWLASTPSAPHLLDHCLQMQHFNRITPHNPYSIKLLMNTGQCFVGVSPDVEGFLKASAWEHWPQRSAAGIGMASLRPHHTPKESPPKNAHSTLSMMQGPNLMSKLTCWQYFS